MAGEYCGSLSIRTDVKDLSETKTDLWLYNLLD